MSSLTLADRSALANFFNSVCPFSAESLSAVLDKIEVRDFESGWRFSEEGGSSDYFGLVLLGIFKLERVGVSGRHYIVDFCAEGAAMSNYTSWLLKEPADLTIEALEPGRIALLRVRHFEEFFRSIPVWNEFIRKILERDLIRLATRERHLLSLDAPQRYEAFVEARADQLSRLLGKDIAAYLGITPVSLSRLIAKRQKQKKKLTDRGRPSSPRERGDLDSARKPFPY